jgi:hypothetical protein
MNLFSLVKNNFMNTNRISSLHCRCRKWDAIIPLPGRVNTRDFSVLESDNYQPHDVTTPNL